MLTIEQTIVSEITETMVIFTFSCILHFGTDDKASRSDIECFYEIYLESLYRQEKCSVELSRIVVKSQYHMGPIDHIVKKCRWRIATTMALKRTFNKTVNHRLYMNTSLAGGPFARLLCLDRYWYRKIHLQSPFAIGYT